MGFKIIETRSWNTEHRGPLLIHASKGKSGSIFMDRPLFKKHIKDFSTLPFGCVVGSVNLVNVFCINDLNVSDTFLNSLTLEDKAFGDYSEGRYGWILEEPILFQTPLPARGMMKLWDMEIPTDHL